MIKLYYLPISPYSHKVTMALLEMGREFEALPVWLFDSNERAQYVKVYPLGKLPLLVDGEQQIPESSIIVEYLDGFSDSPGFIPSEPATARQVRLLDRIADCYISDAAITLIFQNMKPESERDKGRVSKARYQIKAACAMLENVLQAGKGEFLVGTQLSLADLSVMPALRAAANLVPFVDDCPLVAAYYQRHYQRASFQAIDDEANKAMGRLNIG